MEAICDPFLYMWYLHWGEVGSLNGINVFDRSTSVEQIYSQTFDYKTDDYDINGKIRDCLYILVDGIYSWSAIFMIIHPDPTI